MKSKQLVAIRNNAGRVCGEESRINQLGGELMLGDVIWVKMNGSTWWPGQVVDENNVSDGLKPQNRVVGEVLVRLYGSYEYLYVDSMRWRAEFENILKQNNGSYSEIFAKALEQDISCIKPARKLKKGGSEPRGMLGLRKSKKGSCHEKTEETPKKSTNVSAQGKRAVKVVGVTKNSRAAASERASPRRKQDILMSQKRVKSGELTSTPKQDLVQKKLKAKSPNSAMNSPRRQQDNSRTWKRVKSEALVSRKAEKEASKNDTPRQRLAQKKLKANSPNSARSSPRRQHVNSRTLGVKSGELISRKAGEEASKNDASKKQVQKKARAESARVSPRRQPDNSITRRRVDSGELASGKAREAASKCDDPKQDLMKKNLKSNSRTSVLRASGRSQDLSERRTRVMQNLGLIAPFGSPFHRNALALQSDLLATR